MNNEQIKHAVEVLRGGGIVAFPTDTVWGVGAAMGSKEGIEKLYRVKGREEGKPTAVLVTDVHMANKYGVMNKTAWGLAEKHWPGALTLVVAGKGNKVPKEITGGRNTVGLRAPSHELTQQIIKELGEGLVATSANFAGEMAPKTRDEIDKKFLEQVDLEMDGEAGGAEASTVVEVNGEETKVIRQGEVVVN